MKKIIQPVYFENVLFPGGIGFNCKQCGECCFAEPADLNNEEYEAILKRGFRNFADADEHGFKTIRRSESGGCFFLTKDNKCAIHDIKPATCRVTPFIPIDYNATTKTITLKAAPKMASTVGCKGVCSGQLSEECRKEVAHAAQAIIHDLLKMVSEKEHLTVDDARVARIMNRLIQGH